MGIVYKARDPHIDRLVALKVLRRDRVTSDEFVQRFLKEARAIGRLSHRNIVVVYDSGQAETVDVPAELVDLLEIRFGPFLHISRACFDEIASRERINRIDHARFMRDELLRPQRDAYRLLAR